MEWRNEDLMCPECNVRWIGSAEETTVTFECPQCHKMTGRRSTQNEKVAILNNQVKFHLEDVLNELKFGRPAWAQKLIHTWQNEVVQQRLITGEDDIFHIDDTDEESDN